MSTSGSESTEIPHGGYCRRCGNRLETGDLFCPSCCETVDESSFGDLPGRTAYAFPGRYADFWTRLVAFIVDDILLYFPGGVIVVWAALQYPPVVGHTMDSMFLALATLLAVGLISYVGFILAPTAIWGRTLGKLAVGVKVVNEQGQPPGIWRAILREVIGKFVSGLVICLGYIWVAFDREKRGWHDHIAGTYVVSARR